jgi:hypothetical protein
MMDVGATAKLSSYTDASNGLEEAFQRGGAKVIKESQGGRKNNDSMPLEWK